MIFFYFLIWIMPYDRHPIWDMQIAGLTLFYYVGAVCAAYAALYLGFRRTAPRFFETWQARFFAVSYLIALISYFTQPFPVRLTAGPFLTYTALVILFFVTLSVVDSPKRLRLVLMVFIGSVAFASLYVLREWQKGGRTPDFRPGWAVGDSNVFAAIVAISAPIAFYLMRDKRPRSERLYFLGCMGVSILATVLGASRGGFLGLTAGFLVAVYKSRNRFRNLALIFAIVVPILLVAPYSPVQRFLHPTWRDTENIQTRTAAWSGGIHMVAKHPLLGVGLGNFKALVLEYETGTFKEQSLAHNTYLEIAAELGVPTLLLFLALLFSTYRTLEKVRRTSRQSKNSFLELAALGMEAGLAGYCVDAFTVSIQYLKDFWLVIFLAMCMVNIARVAAKKEEKPLLSDATRTPVPEPEQVGSVS